MLYTRCEMCQGTKAIFVEHPSGKGGVPEDCPCTQGKEPGWVPTGVTMKQLERMVDLERALADDPGLSLEKRFQILGDLYKRIDKLMKRYER